MVTDEARGWGLGARIGRFGGEERCAVEVLSRLEKAVGVEDRRCTPRLAGVERGSGSVEAAAGSGLKTPSILKFRPWQMKAVRPATLPPMKYWSLPTKKTVLTYPMKNS